MVRKFHRCHKCGKKAFKRCRYCGNYFCGDDRNANIPKMFRESVLKLGRAEERTEGGHGCPDYYDYLKKKQKEREDKEQKSLDRLIRAKHASYKGEGYDYSQGVPLPTGKTVRYGKRKLSTLTAGGFVLLALVLIGLFVMNQNPEILSSIGTAVSNIGGYKSTTFYEIDVNNPDSYTNGTLVSVPGKISRATIDGEEKYFLSDRLGNKRSLEPTDIFIDIDPKTDYTVYGTLFSDKIEVDKFELLANGTKIKEEKKAKEEERIRQIEERNKPPEIDISELEMSIHEKVNIERQNNGLSSLSYDSELAIIARKHSRDMAENTFFDHVNLQGQEPTDRAEEGGYDCFKDFGSYYAVGIAENIFQNYLYDQYYPGSPTTYEWVTLNEVASTTVQGWMGSPGHRENILTETYDREGIGVVIDSDYEVYITQNFC